MNELDLSYQNPQLVQQYECEDLARDRFVAIPVSDRDCIIRPSLISEQQKCFPSPQP
ncbi:hypothetical protein LC605_00070 [Nostoc sp. CHAB 5836]|uniref:hypothetical protein n=1 Tax=Nostoc sp. CHAB 5836 TaxID=2780404 RepID=UPI001E2ECB7E|nr:hypothetical protein [Nostoc sp. CHAB 5836]MCC5613493.1 hypothetical protein [Nostoc sp. CHAB 5836]